MTRHYRLSGEDDLEPIAPGKLGRVTTPAQMVRDFTVDDGLLLEQSLAQPNLGHDCDDSGLAKYAVGVKWLKTVHVPEAKRFAGMFANQNIVCKLRDPKTIEFLQSEFDAASVVEAAE